VRGHVRGRREAPGTSPVHEENHQEENHARPATSVRRGPGRVQGGKHTAGAAQGRAQLQESELRHAWQKERYLYTQPPTQTHLIFFLALQVQN